MLTGQCHCAIMPTTLGNMKNNLARRLSQRALLLLVAVSPAASGAQVFNPANGHYYELIAASVSWETARIAAAGASHLGLGGHLVTVTDAAENQFLTSAFTADGLHLHWLGGLQVGGSLDPVAGWVWVTGEPFMFANWEPGEPNDANSEDENRLIFDHGTSLNGKAWNDVVPAFDIAAGYVIEYQAVPEPAIGWLLAMGLPFGWFAGRSQRRPAVCD